jgi:carbamate kinase
MSFSVQSEVGQLRQAIVHRPGLELSRLTPQNIGELLFDDVLWAKKAKEEHDVFAETLREAGVRVHYFAQLLATRLGWTIAADGPRWRRVVASPRPLGLVEIETVRSLADAGALLVCGGGGGIPVVRSTAGELTGVEAVVDKDLTAAELAIALKADRLLVLTDVPAIIRGYGTPDAQPIQAIDTVALSAMTFPAGSMGPKVEACIRFVEASGQPAAVGALADAAGILAGRAGTTINAARPAVTEPVR